MSMVSPELCSELCPRNSHQGKTRQFTAVALDQFDNRMTTQPTFTWSVSGPGSMFNVDSNGLYTAPDTLEDTPATIRASADGKYDDANVSVKSGEVVPDAHDDQPLQCVHGCDDTFDGTGDVTVTFDTPAAVEAVRVSGQFLASACPLGADGQCLVGTLELHDVRGQVTLFEARLPGSSGTYGDPCANVGDGNLLTVFDDWVVLPQCDKLTKIVLTNVHHFLFRDATPAEVADGYYGDGPGGDAWCHDWKAAQKVDLWQVRRPRLLELNVADANNPDNKATAIDLAIQELYLPATFTAKAEWSAELAVDAILSSNAAAKDLHLRVECPDTGQVLFDDVRTSLSQTLKLGSKTELKYKATAWLDRNGNNEFDSGEDFEEVRVHLVTPWRAEGDWTAGHAAIAKANAPGAWVGDLARVVAGYTFYAPLLGGVGEITRGKRIDVTPLIKDLEEQLRGNIVLAASATKYAHFPKKPPFLDGSGLTEADVNAIFNSSSWDPPVDCLGMARIVEARGLMRTLKPGEFDRLYETTTRVGLGPQGLLEPRLVLLPELTKLSDWLYFKNNPEYGQHGHPGRDYTGENVIKDSGDSYWGWTGENEYLSAEGWLNKLLEEYNKDLREWQKINLEDVPGFLRTHVLFFKVPKIALDVFCLRTNQLRTP